MKKYFPFLDWLFPYKKENLFGDISAGFTVAVMLIPQGMAYAILAGLPAIYGLYVVTIPLLVYALLGTSRQLAVGPTALVALLLASGVGKIATTGTTEYIQAAILLALMVGVIQLLMGVFKLGFLVNFLSRPVISGFISAAAILIATSQLKYLLGIELDRRSFIDNLLGLVNNIGQVNFYTALLGIGSILLLVFFSRWNKKIPGALIVVVIGMLLVYFLKLDAKGVSILTEMESGFPKFGIHKVTKASVLSLLPIALTISLLGYIQSMAMARTFQMKHQDYQIDANQELRALGFANIIGSFFQSFPTTGGFSRTAVNNQAGAKTGLASMISASLIIVTLIFFMKYFYYLPYTILAAIIIAAVVKLINLKELYRLWNVDKQDFALFLLTALATLFIGIEEGILAGIVLSIGMMIYNVSTPHVAILGEIENTGVYRNVDRFPRARQHDGVLIIRIDSQVFFANTRYIKNFIDTHSEGKHTIIVHCGSIEHLDSSAVKALKDWIKEYNTSGVRVIFTNVIGPVRDIISRYGLYDLFGKSNFFLDVKHATRAVENSTVASRRDILFQTNE